MKIHTTTFLIRGPLALHPKREAPRVRVLDSVASAIGYVALGAGFAASPLLVVWALRALVGTP